MHTINAAPVNIDDLNTSLAGQTIESVSCFIHMREIVLKDFYQLKNELEKKPPRNSVNYRVGILGGSFDPVHLGHRKIGELVDDNLELDALVFMPNYQNPLKTRKPVEPEIRIEMISKGIEDKTNFYCCTYEVDQNKVCYTYDTLTLVKQSLPGVEIYFIMGADNLESLKSWKNYEELGGLCQFVLVSRKGSLDQNLIKNLPNNFNVHFLTSTEELEQNSSAIREDLSAYAIYLDPEIYKIIKKHGIYQ